MCATVIVFRLLLANDNSTVWMFFRANFKLEYISMEEVKRFVHFWTECVSLSSPSQSPYLPIYHTVVWLFLSEMSSPWINLAHTGAILTNAWDWEVNSSLICSKSLTLSYDDVKTEKFSYCQIRTAIILSERYIFKACAWRMIYPHFGR